MDIHHLEYAAEMFFKMCRMHPEICPHDFEWNSSNYKERKHYYTCNLCGAKESREISEQEVLNYCKRWDYNLADFGILESKEKEDA